MKRINEFKIISFLILFTLLLLDLITKKQFLIVGFIILIVYCMIEIIFAKKSKREVIILSVIIIYSVLTIVLLFINDNLANDENGKQKESVRTNNYFIEKYFINDKKDEISNLLADENEKIVYKDYGIQLKTYVYDSETKFAYIELTVENPKFEQQNVDKKEKSIVVDILSKINVNDNEVEPSDFKMNGNTLSLYYFLTDFNGKFVLCDNNKKCIEEYQLEDTVNENIEINSGVYLSPLGIYILGNDENKYNCTKEFDILIEYVDGRKEDIHDIYEFYDMKKDYTEINDLNLGYYLFHDVLDIKQISRVSINGVTYVI